MKRILFGFLFLPFVPACLVDNNVGESANQTAESRVADSADDWCRAACERLADCPGAPCACQDDVCDCESAMDTETCTADCRDYLRQQFVGHGETCAQAGERLMSCADQAGCDVIGGETCKLSAEEESACSNALAPADGPRTCESSGSSGAAPGSENFRCEVSYYACSDGHDYSTACSETPEGNALCTCFVDFEPTSSYYQAELGCPSVTDANVGCGFWLADPEQPSVPGPTPCTGAAGGGSPEPSSGSFGCFAEFSNCDGHVYAVVCSEDSGAPACECVVDGEPQGIFQVVDGDCPGGGTHPDMQRINAGCGWHLSI